MARITIHDAGVFYRVMLHTSEGSLNGGER